MGDLRNLPCYDLGECLSSSIFGMLRATSMMMSAVQDFASRAIVFRRLPVRTEVSVINPLFRSTSAALRTSSSVRSLRASHTASRLPAASYQSSAADGGIFSTIPSTRTIVAEGQTRSACALTVRSETGEKLIASSTLISDVAPWQTSSLPLPSRGLPHERSDRVLQQRPKSR